MPFYKVNNKLLIENRIKKTINYKPLSINHNFSGFTLVEVLLAIAILTILAAVVISLVNPTKRLAQTRDAQRKNDISEIAKALGFYATVTGGFPKRGTCDSSIGQSTSACPPSPEQAGWNKTTTDRIYDALINKEQILKDLPIDPINKSPYYYRYEPKSATMPPCIGTGLVCRYWISARLENPTDPNKPIFRCSDIETLNDGVGCKEVAPSQ